MGFVDKLSQAFLDALNTFGVVKDGGKVLTQEALRDRIMREGDPWMGTGAGSIRWNGVGSSGGQGVASGSTVSPLKGYWVDTFTASVSEDCQINSVGPYLKNIPPNGNGVIGSSPIQNASFIANKGGTVVIPLNGILFSPHHPAPGISITQVFEQDPKITIPSLIANVALTYNKNGGIGNNNTAVGTDKYSCTTNILNNSGGASSGMITIIDKVPSQCRYVSSSGSGWTIGVVGDVLTATTNDVIANTGTKSFTVVFESTKLISMSTSLYGYAVDLDITSTSPPVWWNGTSISAGSSPTSYETHFTYLTKFWLRDVKGKDTRQFNRAIGGGSSVPQELLRRTDNRYETFEAPVMAVLEQGINDSAQGVPTATTIANMQAYVKHVRRKSATCPILILAPFPTGNAPYEALNQTLHLVLGPAVAALNDSRVYYVSSTRTMWNAVTENTTYTTDNIHPNDAGNVKIFEAISGAITANNIY